MMKITAFLIIFSICFSVILHAQPYTLHGKIVDTSSGVCLTNSSVALLRQKDSILVKYTWTDTLGNFSIQNLFFGKYIILVSYPGYADYIDTVLVKQEISLGNINMITRTRLLQEVIVSQNISAIRIKHDTTEYIADSFKLNVNANVEELLKKLPGIQIDRFGTIIAQGQKVKKILVDGEEFFGDDPTLVTQNLLADMVEKVQLFDKKSDQSSFSGINDGVKDKTINIKLKSNKKNGMFGKTVAGAGPDSFMDNQVMVNVFKDKLKYAAFGIISNTGVAGLGWKDQQNYGDANSSGAQVGDGGLYLSISNDDDGVSSWNGTYSGRGLPSVQTGGTHFSNKWNSDKNSVYMNYKIMNLNVEGMSNLTFVNRLPNKYNNGNQKETYNGTSLRNKINSGIDLQLNETASIKMTFDATVGQKDFAGMYVGQMFDGDTTLLNSSQKHVSSHSNDRFLNSNILWRKKFKKKGRTISFNLKNNYNGASSNGHMFSSIHYSKDNSFSLIDQLKINDGTSINIDSKIVYTEPLSSTSSLIFNYGVVANDAKSIRNSFDKDSNYTYTNFNSLNSISYRYSQFAHRFGISYNYSKLKWLLNFGSNIAITKYNQADVYKDTSLSHSFINLYPKALVKYSITTQRQISFEYNGNSVQPSINQIQPVLINDDPLNMIIGNPHLKPAFRNIYRFLFADNRNVSEKYFFTSLTYSATHNAIINDVITDISTGSSKINFLNLTGNNNISLHTSYDFTLKKIDVNMSLNADASISNYISKVNDAIIKNRSTGYSLGFFVGKSKANKFDLRLDLNGSFNRATTNSKQGEMITYYTFNMNSMVDFFLPHKLQFHSEVNYNFQQKANDFTDDLNRILINLSFSKKLLKKDNLTLKASLTDLLNQNFGIDRSLNTNYISQDIYKSVGRILLFSAIWNFNMQKQK